MATHIRYVRRLEATLETKLYADAEPLLPSGFFWSAWSPVSVATHARIMHLAFRDDVDGHIFPTYRQFEACEHLVRATASSRGFAPYSTWLIGRRLEPTTPGSPLSFSAPAPTTEFCAAIQCVSKSKRVGEIQNVSVLPKYRGLGLGRALVVRSLKEFAASGRALASLEVTAENRAALRLYLKLGFVVRRCVFTETFAEFSDNLCDSEIRIETR